MRRLFIGNFDFEHCLHAAVAGRQRQLPDTASRLMEEMATIWTAVADEGDVVWSPVEIEEGFFEELAEHGLPAVTAVTAAAQIGGQVEACPWGWTDEVRRLCRRHGWQFAAPPQDVVREVNSRRFSAELERSWGIGLHGAAVVRSVDELATAIRKLPVSTDHWVVKAEFGMSARERILGRGRAPGEHVVNWFRNRLQYGVAAVLEPWVERIEEAGLQYTVPWSGVPLFEGVAPLLSDPSGRYRGNRFSYDVETELRWMPAVETGMRVARLLKQLGYFGPLGIDAMRYRDGNGEERLRSVQDINARHSMGRLALGLRRLLESGETGSWLHVRWPADDQQSPPRHFEQVQNKLPPDVRLIHTSPLEVRGRPVEHGTLVVTSRSASSLAAAERILLDDD
jgi:hypothetical protein